MSKKTNKTPFIVKIALSAIGLASLTSNLNAGVITGLGSGLGQSTGLTGALNGIGGNDLNSAISNIDGQLPGNELNFPLLLDPATDNITLPGLAPIGRDTNTPSSGNSSGKKAKHKSPIEPISAPLGHSLSPLIDTVDASLDPITNTVDDSITTPIITITSPLTDPLLLIIDPITAPVDGVVSDLTGGSLEDAPTNKDYNRRDGNGAINDLFGNEHQAHGESGEVSLIPIVSKPLGKAADRFISAADEGLDPLTDVIDEQTLEPTLNILAPITEPLLSILEPATDPVDGTLADLTGGSAEDALTNNDDNTEDGNGVVNDLLGGDKNRNKPNDNGTFGNNGNDKPVGNAQGKQPKNKSPIQPISAPLGRSLTPLIDTIDESLDPLTNPIDALLFAPILTSFELVLGPVMEAIAPGTHPVDGIISDFTGGSIEDALADKDYNQADGNGFFNDLFGHGRRRNGGGSADEHSMIPTATRRWGMLADRTVSAGDEGLDPLTDIVDDQLLEPVLDAVAPVTEPVLAAIEPATDPIDGTLADLTGGSVEDALTNNDDNTEDGNGVVNDLLGGDKNRNKPNDNGTFGNNGNDKPVGNAQGKKPKNKSPIEPISAPLGHSLTPLLDTVDEAIDPITDPVDQLIAEPILSAIAPASDPLLEALSPTTNPIDGIVSDLTGGSLEDALTNQDYNDQDGNGLVNDSLGHGRTKHSGKEKGEASPAPWLTKPVGRAAKDLINAVNLGFDPITDVIDDQILEPILDVVAPITEPALTLIEPATDPIDGTLADLTGGSVEDSLTNNDDNTEDGNGVVNDLFGGDTATDSPNDSGSEGSPLDAVIAPIGEAIDPLISAIDQALDPVTDPVDDQVLAPVLDAAAPVIEPILDAAEPVITPVDDVVGDLIGGSVDDALSNNDDNTEDGNGVVNDLIGGGAPSDTPNDSGSEGSPLDVITAPIGEAIDPLISAIDQALDPVTDPVDDQVLAPVLDAAAPVIEPILDAAEPVITPVDDVVGDLTGGSVDDALSNNDSNTADGNGVVNDLIGGDAASDTPNDSGDDASPLDPVTTPIGEVLDPLVTVIDETLDPVTDPLDDQVIAPVLDAAAPVIEPILDVAEPVITPVDDVVGDLTGGSVDDALTNNDDNTEDGNGVVNDLIGGDAATDTPDDSGDGSNASPLDPVTTPIGEVLDPLVTVIDETLDPVTDPLDDQVLAPVLDAAAPVIEPILEGAEPVITPVDDVLGDLTGGSVDDALSNNDSNTADGNGVVNDLIGGDAATDTPNDSGDDASPLDPVTTPIGEVLDPLVTVIDESLDPVTDPLDNQVLAPVLDAAAPVIEPVLEAAEPAITPVDDVVGDLTGGSVDDALSNNDSNTADGNGVVNDLVGGNTDEPASNQGSDPSTGDSSGDSGNDDFSQTTPSSGPTASPINPVDIGSTPSNDPDNTEGSNSTTNDQDLNGNPRFDSDDSMLYASSTNNAASSNNQSTEAKPADNCSLNGKEPIIFQFNVDDASLRDRFISLAKESAELMASCETQQFEVSGHTDNVHTDEYNQKLSESRANEVANYLVKIGIPRSQIIVRGYGESQPLATNDTKSGRALNRRVEIRKIEQASQKNNRKVEPREMELI
jgi:outer membrane protein OmpA-like peptidoglycan-associated protein